MEHFPPIFKRAVLAELPTQAIFTFGQRTVLAPIDMTAFLLINLTLLN